MLKVLVLVRRTRPVCRTRGSHTRIFAYCYEMNTATDTLRFFSDSVREYDVNFYTRRSTLRQVTITDLKKSVFEDTFQSLAVTEHFTS